MSDQGEGNTVIAAYRPKPGCEAELLALVKRHLPALREQGFITARPPLHLQASDGTILEIFEWVPGRVEEAHHHPVVQELWTAFGKVADLPPPGTVPGMDRPFQHFRALDLDA